MERRYYCAHVFFCYGSGRRQHEPCSINDAHRCIKNTYIPVHGTTYNNNNIIIIIFERLWVSRVCEQESFLYIEHVLYMCRYRRRRRRRARPPFAAAASAVAIHNTCVTPVQVSTCVCVCVCGASTPSSCVCVREESRRAHGAYVYCPLSLSRTPRATAAAGSTHITLSRTAAAVTANNIHVRPTYNNIIKIYIYI